MDRKTDKLCHISLSLLALTHINTHTLKERDEV
jgi:hypothetical protein